MPAHKKCPFLFFSLPSSLSPLPLSRCAIPTPYHANHAIPRRPRHTTQTTLFRNRRRVQAERGGVRACGARGEAGSGSAGGEQKRPRGCRSSPQRRRLIRKRPAPHRVGRFFVSLYGVPWGSFAPFFSFAPRSVLPLKREERPPPRRASLPLSLLGS